MRSVGVEGLPVNLDEGSRDNRAAMPLQDNGFDCGMFVVVVANFLSHHLALDFTGADMAFFRQRVTLNLVRAFGECAK